MTHAATLYIDWLNAAAAQAEHAATQAAAAVSAHEAALAAVVPPPVIDANRALRRSLATTNCLGQASPAIADTEADYEQMWAQDADAMYAYAGASAAASTMKPFSSPPTTAGPTRQRAAVAQASGTWAVTSAPETVSAGRQLLSTIPEALAALSSSPLTTFDASMSSVSSSLSKLSSLSAPLDVAINRLNSLNKAAALRTLLPQPHGTAGAALTAGFGRGTSIGTLSVPRGWVTETAMIPATAGQQGGWVCELARLLEATEQPMWPLSH
jgi:PPE-repeat protein